MRNTMRLLAYVLVFLFCALSYLPVSAAEAVGANAIIAWDAVTTDLDGDPETILYYEIAAFPLGTDLVANPLTTALSKAQIEGAQVQAHASTFLMTIPAGSQVIVSVRAVDLAGNISDWANSLTVKTDFGKPKKPTNLKKIWPPVAVVGGSILVALSALFLKRKK
jgi:hypothetical protein